MIMILAVAGGIAVFPAVGNASDFIVYSVYKDLDLGNPGVVPHKDFYINMGSANGIHPGSVVEVVRKSSTYDLANQKLYKDVSFPIATLKVIHVETNAAIARLEKIYSAEKTPATSPRAVMVGDNIRVQE
jgi:hypothetical protein